MSVWGVVVAAGSGERFGSAKHQVDLKGKPLWRWGVEALQRGGVPNVVVVGDVPEGIPGGPRRRDSVAAGLAHVPGDGEYVLIHDAARPLAGDDLVARIVTRLSVGDVDGVIPVVPVRDTIKQVDGDAVTATLDRSTLVAAQTPQGFRTEMLRRAHAHTEDDATDDAGMVEAIGGRVVVVPGSQANLKITYPEDLLMLEALL